MKNIKTLIPDIHRVFEEPHDFAPDRIDQFSKTLANIIAEKINKSDSKPTLRMSNLGSPCSRELWYKMNTPEEAEKLPPEVRVKFLFGDILEALLLFLAEEAGHTVEGQQDTVELNGVKGHRDAIIDGVLVDAKSASSNSFKKFKEHLTYDLDDFGYIDQLQSYLQASQDDPLLKTKDEAAFLVIDKTLGHITLDRHVRNKTDYKKVVEQRRDMITEPEPPDRPYEDVAVGYVNKKTKEFVPNGNRKLGTKCGYCSFKNKCWPGLRTFHYANGPEFLTVVKETPRVEEARPQEGVNKDPYKVQGQLAQ